MGSAISSSAAAAVDSLADDTHLEENDTSAIDNDEEASPPVADIVEAATAASANATRRTARKTQATDFLHPVKGSI